MKLKNKVLLFSLVAVVVVGGLAAVKAVAAENPNTAPGRAKILQRIAAKLNLTADQKSQIKTILVAEKDTVRTLLTNLHAAKTNVRSAIQADNATEASVREASAQAAGAEADWAVERMKLCAQITPILTDEQRLKIADLEQRVDSYVDNVIAGIGSGADH